MTEECRPTHHGTAEWPELGITWSARAFRVANLKVPAWNAYFGDESQSPVQLAFYIWHLRSSTGLNVIVDTGLPGAGEDRDALLEISPFTDIRSLSEALVHFGIRPGDVHSVLITQTITYHTGGLGQPCLDGAAVYAARQGIDEFMDEPPGHPRPELYFTAAGWSYLRSAAIAGRLILPRGPVRVQPGLTFEPTGGHHPGSAAVIYDTPTGQAALLETAFTQRNLTDRHPIGIAEDVAKTRNVIKRFVDKFAVVIPIHDDGNDDQPLSQYPSQEDHR